MAGHRPSDGSGTPGIVVRAPAPAPSVRPPGWWVVVVVVLVLVFAAVIVVVDEVVVFVISVIIVLDEQANREHTLTELLLRWGKP